MSSSFSEEFKVVSLALAPDADRYDSNPSTDWVRVDYRAIFILSEGAGGTGTATITANNASDNAGTGTAAIAFRYRLMTTAGGLDTWGAFTSAASTGYLTIAGANKSVLIEIRRDELDSAKPFVSLTFTEAVNSPVDAGVVALADTGRQGEQIPSIL